VDTNDLGYQSSVFPVEDCLEKYLQVKLKVLPVNINTINVTYYDPHKIIKKALQSVSTNYLNNAANLSAFYREEVCENDDPVQFIEAVLEIYKGSYNDRKDKDRMRILKARGQAELKKSVFFNYLFFVDGPYEALSLDIAKYPKSFIKILQNTTNFLNPKHFKYYEYEFVEAVYDKGFQVHYIINFKPKKNRALLSGQLIIDKQSFSFISVDFYIGESEQNIAQLIRFDNEKYINDEGFYTRAASYHCKASFKRSEGHYSFSNSKIDYSFLFINTNNNDTLTISNSIDFVITSLDTANVNRFKLNQSIWKNVALTKQLGKHDPDFWENYNIIKGLEPEKD